MRRCRNALLCAEREQHMLTITHLTKRYGEKLAVDDLLLRFKEISGSALDNDRMLLI